MKIDVCILTYNNPETIESCVKGVRTALGDALNKFLIVDGGSNDDTINRIKKQMEKHGDIELEVRPDLPMGSARALSFSMARTEWLIQLDADIVLRPNYIRDLLPFLGEDVGGIEPMRMNHFAVIHSNAPWRSLGGQNIIRRSLVPTEIPYRFDGEDEYTRHFIENQGFKWVFVNEVKADHYPCSPKYKSGHFLTRYTTGVDAWANLDRHVRRAPFHKQYVSFVLTWFFWIKWHTRELILKSIHYARGWRNLRKK